jgi:hypothetical protein
MSTSKSIAIAFFLSFANAEFSFAATVPGSIGDGVQSLYYVALTGEFGLQPDGQPNGLFDVQ